MKTIEQLLKELNACNNAIEWADNKSIEEIVKTCHRGDWLLWLAEKVNVPLQELILAKGYCAKTVIYLMKDDRSKDAVKFAILFGNGKITKKKLNTIAVAATAAADDAYAAYAAAAAAADAAYVAAYAAAAAATAADASHAAYAAAAYVAATAAADDDATTIAYVAATAAKKDNQSKTANLCRKYIGQLIINNVSNLLK